MRRIAVIIALVFSSILLIAVFSVLLSQSSSQSSDTRSFYLGVTYCGESVEEAKQLIDRVKNYTNLFVLQSGSLQYGHRLDETRQIIDYAVDSNLHFIVYFGQYEGFLNDWFEIFNPRWNSYFLGIYSGDEPGGKMLDDYTRFYKGSSQDYIEKWVDGSVKVDFASLTGSRDPTIIYYRNGTILVEKFDYNIGVNIRYIFATYQPNGAISVKIQEHAMSPIIEGNEEDAPYSLETVQNMYPFDSYDKTADLFVDLYRSKLAIDIQGYSDFTYFTSDYVLYWFDYLSGYDVILTQFGWNHTMEQDIALVRGAANLQNKNWGAIITWKYSQPPYLDSGEAIFEQLCTAYETGAKYAVFFNYAENMTGPYGILQDEHFVALERFWNEVVQNPEVKQDSIRGEVILLLPKNYGWGMRTPEDKIWGLWGSDEKSGQIWNLRSDLIQEYGLNLDIVYDDPSFPVEGKYREIFYWNQTI